MLRTAIITFLAAACLATQANAEIGRVKRASGDAFIERAGARIDAAPGVTVDANDVLVTGADGKMSITFIDNSRFSIGPESRVTLDRFEFNSTTHEGDFETGVEKGSLAVISGQIAKEAPDAMKVRTPTSILGVRGTRFIIEVD
ncbi:MAG: FecR domain-containing protein [Pseudomonadota bacterium]